MFGRRVVYIIPGFDTSPRYKPFLEAAKIFRQYNIKPILVDINWKSSLKDYISQVIKKYNNTKRDGDIVYIFGFSAGAWIALMAATKLNPHIAILCSPSPFFKEDIRYWRREWIGVFGEERFRSFNNYKFNTIMRKFKSGAIIFVGDKEYPLMIRRAKAIHKSVKRSRLIIIKSGEHDLSKKSYMNALNDNLTRESLF